jgi:hypothetical protein
MELENRFNENFGLCEIKPNICQGHSAKRNIQKAILRRPKHMKICPNIPDHLSGAPDGQPFDLLNDTVFPKDPAPNTKRIIIFMSPCVRDMLAGCCSWYVDGTFEPASKTHFYQTVFVVGLSALEKSVPFLYTLLSNKKKTKYIRLAEALMLEMEKAPEVKVNSITMDCERA